MYTASQSLGVCCLAIDSLTSSKAPVLVILMQHYICQAPTRLPSTDTFSDADTLLTGPSSL